MIKRLGWTTYVVRVSSKLESWCRLKALAVVQLMNWKVFNITQQQAHSDPYRTILSAHGAYIAVGFLLTNNVVL